METHPLFPELIVALETEARVSVEKLTCDWSRGNHTAFESQKKALTLVYPERKPPGTPGFLPILQSEDSRPEKPKSHRALGGVTQQGDCASAKAGLGRELRAQRHRPRGDRRWAAKCARDGQDSVCRVLEGAHRVLPVVA